MDDTDEVPALLSILAAVFATMVGVAKLHPTGSGSTQILSNRTGFSDSMVALMDIVMAYCEFGLLLFLSGAFFVMCVEVIMHVSSSIVCGTTDAES